MTPKEVLKKYRWVETITDGGYNPPKPEYNFRELYSALRTAVEELERAQETGFEVVEICPEAVQGNCSLTNNPNTCNISRRVRSLTRDELKEKMGEWFDYIDAQRRGHKHLSPHLVLTLDGRPIRRKKL